MNKPVLIKAIHPADLLEQVTEALKQGSDMLSPIFVSHEGLLCQWVTPSMCLYEYKLIVAVELDDLERQAQNLMELGYDFFMNVVLWEGFYLQWMSRLNNSGLMVKNAAVKVAEQPLHLEMVEDVQALLRLVPTAKHVVPYPVLVS